MLIAIEQINEVNSHGAQLYRCVNP